MFSQIYFTIIIYSKKIENNANAKHKNNLSLHNRIIKKKAYNIM